jgi:hypothetical protein
VRDEDDCGHEGNYHYGKCGTTRVVNPFRSCHSALPVLDTRRITNFPRSSQRHVSSTSSTTPRAEHTPRNHKQTCFLGLAWQRHVDAMGHPQRRKLYCPMDCTVRSLQTEKHRPGPKDSLTATDAAGTNWLSHTSSETATSSPSQHPHHDDKT